MKDKKDWIFVSLDKYTSVENHNLSMDDRAGYKYVLESLTSK